MYKRQPLARGHKVDDPELVAIAEKLGCTPAQVAIKFCYDSGCITIPKSSRPERIIENLQSLDIDISSQMDAIKGLECDYVSGWDPTTEPWDGTMESINLQEKLSKFSDHWAPKVIAEMNDYQFKLVKVEGEFIWHNHPDTDEVFICLLYTSDAADDP